MQAGYSYNREAQAKALKAAVRNRKKDKVLYGAVIKAENAFGSKSTSSTQTGAQTNSSGDGSNDPTLLKKPEVSVVATVSAKTEPVKIDPFDKAANSTNMVGLNPLVEELKKKLLLGNLGLKPVDSRQPNVSVGPPITSAPSNTTSMIPSIDRTPPVAVNTRNIRSDSTMTIGSEYSDSSPIADTTTATIGSATDMELEQLGQIPTPSNDNIQPIDRMDPKIQTAALDLFNKLQKDRADKGVNPSNSERFTARRSDGSTVPDLKVIMRLNKKGNTADNYWFSFIRYNTETNREGKTIQKSPSVDGIDILSSIKEANVNFNNGLFRPNAKPTETTGLGVGAPNIGSSRVVFRSRKGGDGLTKNQLYLMLPQLIKGHIRLYNKSGRPVVSRSNVSPSFQRLAKDIVERNTFEADDYSGIDSKESADVNKFIESTKPIQPRNINRLSNADTIWQLKKRYEVLVGELSAGNHGKLVRDEMETILRTLIRLHAMNQDKGRELIRSLRDW